MNETMNDEPAARGTTRPPRSGGIAASVAGWTAVAFGVIHIVVAPLGSWQVWAEIFDRGPWATISLDVTSENLVYSEAFWVGPGSFGVPVLLIGAFVLWTVRRGETVPVPFGWAMIAWGVGLVALLPKSPAWALLGVGVLLVVAAKARAQVAGR